MVEIRCKDKIYQRPKAKVALLYAPPPDKQLYPLEDVRVSHAGQEKELLEYGCASLRCCLLAS